MDAVGKLLGSTRESKYVEFKRELDAASEADWCELVKDLVALANSGGGAVGIGLDNRGLPTGFDPSGVLGVDPAHVADRIHRYTGVHFGDIEIVRAEKGGQAV